MRSIYRQENLDQDSFIPISEEQGQYPEPLYLPEIKIPYNLHKQLIEAVHQDWWNPGVTLTDQIWHRDILISENIIQSSRRFFKPNNKANLQRRYYDDRWLWLNTPAAEVTRDILKPIIESGIFKTITGAILIAAVNDRPHFPHCDNNPLKFLTNEKYRSFRILFTEEPEEYKNPSFYMTREKRYKDNMTPHNCLWSTLEPNMLHGADSSPHRRVTLELNGILDYERFDELKKNPLEIKSTKDFYSTADLKCRETKLAHHFIHNFMEKNEVFFELKETLALFNLIDRIDIDAHYIYENFGGEASTENTNKLNRQLNYAREIYPLYVHNNYQQINSPQERQELKRLFDRYLEQHLPLSQAEAKFFYPKIFRDHSYVWLERYIQLFGYRFTAKEIYRKIKQF